MSDVPLGVLLSGGVDSTAILALAQGGGRKRPRDLHGRLRRPGVRRARSSPRGRRALRHRTTTRFVVDAPEFLDAWSRLAWYRDEPIAEASEIPLLLLAEFAGDTSRSSSRATAATRCSAATRSTARMLSSSRGRTAPLRWLAERAFEHLACDRPTGSSTAPRRRSSIRDPLVRWVSWFRTPGRRHRASASSTPNRSPSNSRSVWRRHSRPYASSTPAVACCSADMFTYLPDNMLLRSDKVLMAGSLEGRMPLMDVVARRARGAAPAGRARPLAGKAPPSGGCQRTRSRRLARTARSADSRFRSSAFSSRDGRRSSATSFSRIGRSSRGIFDADACAAPARPTCESASGSRPLRPRLLRALGSSERRRRLDLPQSDARGARAR